VLTALPGAARRSDRAAAAASGAALSSRAAAAETFRVLPPSEKPYSDYDFDVLGEIVHHATERAATAAGGPRGACERARAPPAWHRSSPATLASLQHAPRRQLTAHSRRPAGAQQQGLSLDRLLKSYQAVLLRHSVLPEQDFHYYRLLLKLFLDPNPDWWAKLYNERMAARWAPPGGAAVAAASRLLYRWRERRGSGGWRLAAG
jgi:hypothetical protein